MSAPYPIYAPLPLGSRIIPAVDCLIAASCGDPDDYNKAAGDQIDDLSTRFLGLLLIATEATNDPTLDLENFTYYALMEAMGHGVGLSDDRSRWGEENIDIARDKGGRLYAALREMANWMEMNLDRTSDWTITVRAVVEVYTERAGEEHGDIAISYAIDNTRDVENWLDGIYGSQDDANVAETTFTITALDLARLLDTVGADEDWTVNVESQTLLLLDGGRSFPTIYTGDVDDPEAEDAIGAVLSVHIVSVRDENRDAVDPEEAREIISRGRDSYYKKYAAPK